MPKELAIYFGAIYNSYLSSFLLNYLILLNRSLGGLMVYLLISLLFLSSKSSGSPVIKHNSGTSNTSILVLLTHLSNGCLLLLISRLYFIL